MGQICLFHMNLVAKEGPVDNQHNGVLVLSRTASAFQQLREAVIPVLPHDKVETAKASFDSIRGRTPHKVETGTTIDRAGRS